MVINWGWFGLKMCSRNFCVKGYSYSRRQGVATASNSLKQNFYCSPFGGQCPLWGESPSKEYQYWKHSWEKALLKEKHAFNSTVLLRIHPQDNLCRGRKTTWVGPGILSSPSSEGGCQWGGKMGLSILWWFPSLCEQRWISFAKVWLSKTYQPYGSAGWWQKTPLWIMHTRSYSSITGQRWDSFHTHVLMEGLGPSIVKCF